LSFLSASATLFDARADEASWFQREAPKENYWSAYLGGEWDFLSDDGPPLSGEDWQEFHTGLGYVDRRLYNLFVGYRLAGRSDQFDNVITLDGQARIVSGLWFRGAVYGSPDHDFVYRLRTDAELEYQFPYVTVGAGYWFYDFNANYVHSVTPFVRFYWNNFSLEGRYLNIFDTGEDTHFNAGSTRLDYFFDKTWARPFFGAVFGQRIFGILTLQQSPSQDGYLLYGGNTLALTPRLDLTATLSYADEDPSFHYIGAGIDLKLRF
jgi:YaiO family outer membrane protein